MSDPALIRFACEHCGRRVKARATDRGRRCVCAGCGERITVPDTEAADHSFGDFDGDLIQPPHSLKGLTPAIAVSLAAHAAFLLVLAMIVFQKQDPLRITLLVSQLPEQSALDLVLTEVMMPPDNEAGDTLFGEPLDATEILTTSLMPVVSVAGPENSDKAPQAGGSGATAAGNSGTAFSAVTQQRLTLAKGKTGDFEVALIWNGLSDLDLHVGYTSHSGSTRRVINWLLPGRPDTGYLDVDANSGQSPLKREPIEHVRWNNKRPPGGIYEIGVHGFELRGDRPGAIPPAQVSFTVEVKTPDGVQTYTGSVGHRDFASVSSLQIGGSTANPSQEEQANRLLAQAREDLDAANSRSKSVGRAKLNAIVRRFPKTTAANEARKLLPSLSP